MSAGEQERKREREQKKKLSGKKMKEFRALPDASSSSSTFTLPPHATVYTEFCVSSSPLNAPQPRGEEESMRRE
jgi:hypothetical protein